MPQVDVIARVRPFGAAAEVTSPISGAAGLVVRLELFEAGTSLGAVVLGDAIELQTEEDGARYVVFPRRATFGFVNEQHVTALEDAPPELVPLLVRSRGGTLSVSEHVLRDGDRVRLRAQVEAGLVRDDAVPVLLDEVT